MEDRERANFPYIILVVLGKVLQNLEQRRFGYVVILLKTCKPGSEQTLGRGIENI